MHANETAVTAQSNKINLNEVTHSEALLAPLYGELRTNLWPTQSIIRVLSCAFHHFSFLYPPVPVPPPFPLVLTILCV